MSSLSVSHIASLCVSLAAGAAVIAIRLRAAKKPTSWQKIVMPPIGMATGFAMFAVPVTRIPWSWGIAAFLAGALLFSLPLIWTSRFQIRDGQIYLQRSKAFVLIIAALLIVRLLMHDVVERYVSIPQTAAIFFVLAFGMILPWRLAMLWKYAKIRRTPPTDET